MTFRGKKVAVVGLGKSGRAAYECLKKMEAKVCLYDGKEDLDVQGYEDPVYLGDFPVDVFSTLDCAVFSPGVPLSIPLAGFLREKRIPIIGEIELAYQMEKGRVIGITGTNGKTTTTALVGEIMKSYNEETFVVGNIGNPYTREVMNSSQGSVTVAEISSFQLETIDRFAPHVSAILNITPDHLDRHGSMEAYMEAKFAITRNQTEKDLCVLNYEDPVLRERARHLPCRVEFFSSKREIENGLYQNENQDIVDAATGQVLMNMRDSRIPGDHNCENIMAAILMTREMGVDMDRIIRQVKAFQAVEHRVEFVRTVYGVDYYNDSKGTNPDAAIKGIQSMNKPTILIGGGFDKGADFDQWLQAFDGKVKKLLLMGQTRDKIAEAANRLDFQEYTFVDNLEEAVRTAAAFAEEGDAVLLSPACASWDMFDSYEQRGTMFKQYVCNL